MEEVGRQQHQGIDRPGVRQVPDGSGDRRKMEETGGEVICGAPTTLTVKGYMKVKVMLIAHGGLRAFLVSGTMLH